MARVPACPFFGRFKRESLTCLRDGADTTGGELQLTFPSVFSRTQYWKQHCCGCWECCTLAQALEEEYGRQAAHE